MINGSDAGNKEQPYFPVDLDFLTRYELLLRIRYQRGLLCCANEYEMILFDILNN